MEMEVVGSSTAVAATASEDEGDLRRGPWTLEEDVLLVDYIAEHGEGRWNSLARCAGLRRTGKSCRLRWLNYLRPDVRRGNITPEEQLLILDLHSRWGNRWSKIAQYLPGRTDNEIKNYWRTRVQKHAKQLKCDVNSKQFRDVVRLVWMPRLVERMQADSSVAAAVTGSDVMAVAGVPATRTMGSPCAQYSGASHRHVGYTSNSDPSGCRTTVLAATSPDTSSTFRSSSSATAEAPWHGTHLASSGSGYTAAANDGAAVVQCTAGECLPVGGDLIHGDELGGSWSELLAATGLPDFEFGDFDDNLWSLEDSNCLQQQCS